MAKETDALQSMLRAALHAYEQARAVRLEAGRQIAGELNQANQTLNAAQSAEQARLEEMLRRKLAVAGGEQTRLGHLAAALAHLEQAARDLLTQAGLAHIAGAPLAVDGGPAPARRGDAEVTALFASAQTSYVELREALYLLAASQLSNEQWEAARKSVAPLLADKSAPFYDGAFELQRQSYLRPAQQALEAGKWEAVRTTLEPWLKGRKEDEEMQAVDLWCESYYRQGKQELEQQHWAAALTLLTALADRKQNFKDVSRLQRQALDGNLNLNPKLDLNLVYVPAGEFIYDVGNQRVTLKGFWISYNAINYSQFKVFMDATGYSASPGGSGNAPVNNVSWNDAQAFCAWAGVTLPTEQQWLRAALSLDEQGKRRIDVGRIEWEWCANDHEYGGKALRKFVSDGAVGSAYRSGSVPVSRIVNYGFRVASHDFQRFATSW